MSEQITETQTLSFAQLCNIFKSIEIPMIQRDYAQGRINRTSLLNAFLESIWDSLTGEPLVLDFVYGSSKNGVFQPLDGQQRLTTLFLIHWYFAKTIGSLEIDAQFLERFSYETRTSSHEFCKNLVAMDETLLKSGLTPSGVILNQPWYRRSWKHDPTIAGMIRVLDRVAEKTLDRSHQDIQSFWTRLLDPERPAISFHYLPLEGFGLSDDLYIKMNARGIALTPFENFKSSLEKKIRAEKWDHQRTRSAYFEFMVDNQWTDFFWHRFGKNGYDSAMLGYIVNSFVTSSLLRNTLTPEDALTLLKEPKTISAKSILMEDYNHIYQCFDALEQIKQNPNIIDVSIPMLRLFKHDKLDVAPFDSACKSQEPRYKDRIFVYAQQCFWIQIKDAEFNSLKYLNWLRVVRNILRNANIESPDAFKGALQLINELSNGCLDIYSHLANAKAKTRFAQNQLNNEYQKARLIVKDDSGSYKRVLQKLEDTGFCEGNLGMLFEFVDRLQGSFHQLQMFEEALRIIEAYFQNGIQDEHRRALLTIGHGEFYKYWHSWLYVAKCFKYRLIDDMEDFHERIKEDSLKYSFVLLFRELLYKTPTQIIDDFTPDEKTKPWKTALIKNSGAFTLANSGKKYIACNDDWDYCYLLKGVRESDLNSLMKLQ